MQMFNIDVPFVLLLFYKPMNLIKETFFNINIWWEIDDIFCNIKPNVMQSNFNKLANLTCLWASDDWMLLQTDYAIQFLALASCKMSK